MLTWRGQMYRAIADDRAQFTRSLFDDGIVERLVDRRLLVPTTMTPLQLDGYALVVHHARVPFPAYPTEWCAGMFKDAALAHLELREELARHDLTLKDTHPWNMLFDGTTPMQVDFGSVAAVGEPETTFSAEKYRRYYLYPLELMCRGRGALARCLLSDWDGVRNRDVRRRGIRSLLPRLRERRGGDASLERLRREVARVRVPAVDAVERADGEQQRLVSDIVRRLRPESALVFTNEPRIPLAVASEGISVAAASHDDRVATALYGAAKERRLRLLALVLDFARPTPDVGHLRSVSISATERLRAEFVSALGLLRHAVYERSLSFDHVAEGLAAFSGRSALVDFVPPQEHSGYAASRYPWATRATFLSALQGRFAQVTALDEAPNLFLCEKS